jgi:hypothetical protein
MDGQYDKHQLTEGKVIVAGSLFAPAELWQKIRGGELITHPEDTPLVLPMTEAIRWR